MVCLAGPQDRTYTLIPTTLASQGEMGMLRKARRQRSHGWVPCSKVLKLT